MKGTIVLFVIKCVPARLAIKTTLFPLIEDIEEITLLTIVILLPAVNLSCLLFIAVCNPEVFAKDKSPSFIKFCFKSKFAWVITPIKEMTLSIIVIFSPGIKIFCFELSVSLTSILSSVNGSSMVRVVAFIYPDIAGV